MSYQWSWLIVSSFQTLIVEDCENELKFSKNHALASVGLFLKILLVILSDFYDANENDFYDANCAMTQSI